MGHPEHRVGDVLGAPAGEAAIDHARQRHLAPGDRDIDIGRIDVVVLGQALVDVLADALVGARVVARAAAAVAHVGGARAIAEGDVPRAGRVVAPARKALADVAVVGGPAVATVVVLLALRAVAPLGAGGLAAVVA